MKVYVNGIWYDAEQTPIQIQLSNADKKNIADMHEDVYNYICFPDDMSWEAVKTQLSDTPVDGGSSFKL